MQAASGSPIGDISSLEAASPESGAPENRRFALKRATDEAHGRVEGVIQNAGMFASLEAYRGYLAASWEVRSRFEAMLDAGGAERVWADWPSRGIAHLIAEDIEDLGGFGGGFPTSWLPETPLAAEKEFEARDPAELLGVLYVLEGSSLGARVLVNMASALGLSATFGARHLFAQANDRNAWRSFLAAMTAAPEAPSVAAALATFEAFGDAYSWHALRPVPAGSGAIREAPDKPAPR